MKVKFKKCLDANDHLHYMIRVVEDIQLICDMISYDAMKRPRILDLHPISASAFASGATFVTPEK